jgi:hypothetical protein
MVGKNLSKCRRHLSLPYELTAIESNGIPILSEESSEIIGVATIPAIQQLPIKRTNFALTWG